MFGSIEISELSAATTYDPVLTNELFIVRLNSGFSFTVFIFVDKDDFFTDLLFFFFSISSDPVDFNRKKLSHAATAESKIDSSISIIGIFVENDFILTSSKYILHLIILIAAVILKSSMNSSL